MLRSKIEHDATAPHDDHLPVSAPKSISNAVHLLHRAGQCADEVFTIKMVESAMTPRQFAVLKAVEASSNPSQNTLVELTGIDRSTIADIVRRLVERRLLQRRRTRRDARMYALKLTVKGSQILRQADPMARATDDEILSSLTPMEREVFIRALGRIVETMGPISSARVSRSDPAKA